MNQLAIVIPYYKLYCFEETLTSLKNQTNKQFNLYIGDDASPENPAHLLADLKKSLPFVYKRFETNLGQHSIVKQWNRCLNMMCGEPWFMILGDDDFLSTNYVEAFYTHLYEIEKNHIKVIKFASQDILLDTGNRSKIFTRPKFENSLKIYVNRVKDLDRSTLSEHIFKLSSYQKIGFKNLPFAWHSDDLAILEFSNFKTIYSINNAVAYITKSTQSVSGSNKNIKEKTEASILFYTLLLTKYSHFCNKEQRKFFYEKLAWYISLKNHKKLSIATLSVCVNYQSKYYIKKMSVGVKKLFSRAFHSFNFQKKLWLQKLNSKK